MTDRDRKRTDEEVRTSQISIGSVPIGAIGKLIEKFGVPTVMLIAVCIAFFFYFRWNEQTRAEREWKLVKKINRIEQIVRAQKGCTLNLNDEEDEDSAWDGAKGKKK